MILFALAATALALAVLAAVLLPLLRGAAAAPPREAFDRAVFRDQLAELERERASGLIGAEEAAAARLELQRRLLRAAGQADPRPAPASRAPGLALALAALAASGAGLIYLATGSPGLPAQPFAARAPDLRTVPPGAETQQAMIRGMVERLAARLEAEPDDPEGWQRLGRAWGVLGEREKSATAYARAGALRPDDLSLALAEAQALLEGLPPEAPFPPRALALLRRVRAAEPNQPAALWHLGVEAAKRGALAEAAALWEQLLAVLPRESEDARLVRSAIGAVQRK